MTTQWNSKQLLILIYWNQAENHIRGSGYYRVCGIISYKLHICGVNSPEPLQRVLLRSVVLGWILTYQRSSKLVFYNGSGWKFKIPDQSSTDTFCKSGNGWNWNGNEAHKAQISKEGRGYQAQDGESSWSFCFDMVSGYQLNIFQHERSWNIKRVQICSFFSLPFSMDVETEIHVPFARPSSQNGFASAKRPRTDEGEDGNRVVNLSRDGLEHRNGNGVFFEKRPYQPIDYSTSALQSSRRFLPIKANGLVYESEDCRPKGETLFTPLKDDVIINTRNIEQFTFTNGSFFIGDESSRFNRTVQGTDTFLPQLYTSLLL